MCICNNQRKSSYQPEGRHERIQGRVTGKDLREEREVGGDVTLFHLATLKYVETHEYVCMYFTRAWSTGYTRRQPSLHTTHVVAAAAAACLQEEPADEKLDFFNSDRECTFLLQLRENQERTFPCTKHLQSRREVQFHLKLNLAWPNISQVLHYATPAHLFNFKKNI